jgi:hypothetical protein
MTTGNGVKALRDFAARCRQLAHTVRSDAAQREMIELAEQMEEKANEWKRDGTG